MHTGAAGMVGLVAYAGGGEAPHLLRHLNQPDATNTEGSRKIRATAAPTNGRLETTK